MNKTTKDNITQKLKKVFSLFAFLAAFVGSAQDVQIGSGETTTTGGGNTIPVTNYDYSYGQMIILESDITGAGGPTSGEINKLKFRTATIGTVGNWSNWKIFMGHTTLSQFASETSWIPVSQMQVVFEGTISPVANGWWEIVLTTPFQYTGGNIVIAIDENSFGWENPPAFYTFAAGQYRGIMNRDDGNNILPESPGTAWSRPSNLPQMKLGFVANCMNPSDLTVSNVTGNQADVAWTASQTTSNLGYEWELHGAGSNPSTATNLINSGTTAVGVTSVNLTSLSSNTPYTIYVRTKCSTTESSFWESKNFLTACLPVSSFPWTEDFESVTPPNLPGCWSVLNNNADNDVFVTYATNGVDNSKSVGIFTDNNAGNNDDYLILPKMTLTGEQRMRFSVRARSASEPNDYRVVLSTTGNNAADFTTVLKPLTTVSNVVHQNIDWIDLSAYTGDVYIAVHIPQGGLDGWYIYFDNFIVEKESPCKEPINLSVSNIDKNTATISWEPVNGNTVFDVQVLPEGTLPTAVATDPLITGTTLNKTGLTPSTTYDVYVRSNCNALGEANSFWVGPVKFKTLCDYPTVTVVEPSVLCAPEAVTLQATASTTTAVLKWYETATSTDVLHTGASFTTPVISQNTSYFVEAAEVQEGADVAIGSGTEPGTNYGQNPFGRHWGGTKHQYIFTAQELNAAGMSAGEITALKFTVGNPGSGTRNDFTVSLGTTTESVATSTHKPNSEMTLVYSNTALALQAGEMQLTFDTPYVWDGVNNLVVQFNFSNVDSGNFAQTNSMLYHTTTSSMCTYTTADNRTAAQLLATNTGGVSGSGGTYTSPSRINVKFVATTECASTREEVEIQLSQNPVNAITGTTTNVCEGEVVTLNSGNDATGITVTWSPATNLYTDASATVPYVDGAHAAVVYAKSTDAGTLTYTATATNADACSETGVFTINYDDKPVVTTTNFTSCSEFEITDAINTQAVIVVGGTTANTIHWYSAIDATTPITTISATGTYYVEVVNGTCVSDRVSVDVEVLAGALDVDTTQEFCGTTTIADLVATPAAGFSYRWYSSAASTTPLASTTVIPNGVHTYYVVQYAASCDYHTPKTAVTVKVGTVPAATPAITTSIYCQSTTVADATANLNAPAGAVVKWYNSETSTTALATSTALATGTYYVEYSDANNPDCKTTREAINITVHQLATVQASAQQFCNAATVGDLVATGAVAGAQYVWYNSSTATTSLASTTPIYTGTYYVAQTIDGCVSGRVPVLITVTNGTPLQINPVSVCEGATIAQAPLFQTSGTTYRWYASATATTPLSSSQVLASGVYYVSRVQQGCESNRVAVQVTVNPRPAAPTGDAVQAFEIVYPSDATIANLQASPSGVVWYITAQDAETDTNRLQSNMPLVNGVTYYGVIINENGCPSAPLAVTVTVTLGTDKFDLTKLNYYPNPVEDVLNINYQTVIEKVSVYNLLGQEVRNYTFDSENVQVDLSGLASGTYMVQLKTATQTHFVKIVKK